LLDRPLVAQADTLVCRDGKVAALGPREALEADLAGAERILDAGGATVAAGLIDSHCRVALGDYLNNVRCRIPSDGRYRWSAFRRQLAHPRRAKRAQRSVLLLL
jgi:hypothetical protein